MYRGCIDLTSNGFFPSPSYEMNELIRGQSLSTQLILHIAYCDLRDEAEVNELSDELIFGQWLRYDRYSVYKTTKILSGYPHRSGRKHTSSTVDLDRRLLVGSPKSLLNDLRYLRARRRLGKGESL